MQMVMLQRCPSFQTKSKMQNQPPQGYPSENPPTTGKKKRMKCAPRSKAKGERGFIEGCLWGLCCCWLCEVCFD